jgi:hypothetical protein
MGQMLLGKTHRFPRNAETVPGNILLATLRSARNVRYEIHFKMETARTSTLAGVRWLLMPAGFSCYEISHYMLTTFIRFSRKTY